MSFLWFVLVMDFFLVMGFVLIMSFILVMGFVLVMSFVFVMGCVLVMGFVLVMFLCPCYKLSLLGFCVCGVCPIFFSLKDTVLTPIIFFELNIQIY